MIRYIDISQMACDVTFGIFLVSWFITRHFFFVFVIKSEIIDAPKFISFDALPEDGYYFSKPAYFAFSSMLLSLQVRPALTISSLISNLHTGTGPSIDLVLDDLSGSMARSQRQWCCG